ncbi:hypothetical protein BDB01DRAFT_101058 [Pilobolus umbonatus]|nr:hypothetical protein BDB01DRAFT_101058 [Pilobolus umbonatus]
MSIMSTPVNGIKKRDHYKSASINVASFNTGSRSNILLTERVMNKIEKKLENIKYGSVPNLNTQYTEDASSSPTNHISPTGK